LELKCLEHAWNALDAECTSHATTLQAKVRTFSKTVELQGISASNEGGS
jgi:hypothetical protein